MSDPQQPEARRSGKGAATPQSSRSKKAAQEQGSPQARAEGRHKHATDRGEKGGGQGGGTPPAQAPDHP